MFFIPGAPCDGYFISNYCYLTTDQYEAFHAPLLADFVFLLIPGVPGRTQPSLRTALSNTVGIMITLWSAGKKFPSTTSLKPSNPSCFPSIVTEVPTTFTNQYPFFPFSSVRSGRFHLSSATPARSCRRTPLLHPRQLHLSQPVHSFFLQ